MKNVTDGIASIGAESIIGIGRFEYSKTKYVPLEFYTQMRKGHVTNGDVLLYKDGGRPGEFEPHVTLVDHSFPFVQCCINEHVYRLRAEPNLPQTYLYFWLESDSCMDEMRSRGTGVAIPGLNSTAVREVAILLPMMSIVRQFEVFARPLADAIFANSNQSRTLAATRDALLPRLLSGEVRVREAEKMIEEIL